MFQFVHAVAAMGHWSQCGGKEYDGDTDCDDGSTCTCVEWNEYYHKVWFVDSLKASLDSPKASLRFLSK